MPEEALAAPPRHPVWPPAFNLGRRALLTITRPSRTPEVRKNPTPHYHISYRIALLTYNQSPSLLSVSKRPSWITIAMWKLPSLPPGLAMQQQT